MIYKVTTFIFMATSVVFASLYFVEKSIVRESYHQTAILELPEKQIEKRALQSTRIKNNIDQKEKSQRVVITKEVPSHPELTREEIDLMLEIKRSMSRDYSRRLEREHPFLFERLQLNEDQKDAFKLLIGERRLGMNMRPADGIPEQEKEEYKVKKDEILANIDEKIADILGDQTEVYFNYREKSRQYEVVFDMNRYFQGAGDQLNIDQQDQLADLMYESRSQAQVDQIDWRSVRESPEKADQLLSEYKARHELLKSRVEFLSDNQKDVFVRHLDSRYNRFERWLKGRKRDTKR